MNDAVKKTLTLSLSAAVGITSGFLGGGGGMLAVPLLSSSGLDVKRAHATALFVMLPVCILSAIIYVVNGYFDVNALLCACIGVTVGGAAGAALLNKLNGSVIGIIFAALMIAIGVKMVV